MVSLTDGIDAFLDECLDNIQWLEDNKNQLRKKYGPCAVLVWYQNLKYVARNPEILEKLGRKLPDDTYVIERV